MTKVRDVLAHYGIQGMKWGIRRFQPYPPGQEDKGVFKGEDIRKQYGEDKKAAYDKIKKEAKSEKQSYIDALKVKGINDKVKALVNTYKNNKDVNKGARIAKRVVETALEMPSTGTEITVYQEAGRVGVRAIWVSTTLIGIGRENVYNDKLQRAKSRGNK